MIADTFCFQSKNRLDSQLGEEKRRGGEGATWFPERSGTRTASHHRNNKHREEQTESQTGNQRRREGLPIFMARGFLFSADKKFDHMFFMSRSSFHSLLSPSLSFSALFTVRLCFLLPNPLVLLVLLVLTLASFRGSFTLCLSATLASFFLDPMTKERERESDVLSERA